MDDLKIKRFQRTGKRIPISLHKRIQELSQKYENLKDRLIAVKWLGNAGSHSNTEITKDDVLDAYDILSTVLDEIYDNKLKKVNKKAKAINKKKGPASKGKKRSSLL